MQRRPQTRIQLGTGKASHVMHHTSHISHHTSHITHHTSHITHQTSHITHHTSHITHHTSHITHHTSHITRHTSHATAMLHLHQHEPGAGQRARAFQLHNCRCCQRVCSGGRSRDICSCPAEHWRGWGRRRSSCSWLGASCCGCILGGGGGVKAEEE